MDKTEALKMNTDLISKVIYSNSTMETFVVFDGETESVGRHHKNLAIDLAHNARVGLTCIK